MDRLILCYSDNKKRQERGPSFNGMQREFGRLPQTRCRKLFAQTSLVGAASLIILLCEASLTPRASSPSVWLPAALLNMGTLKVSDLELSKAP